jgi:hypothetical protein
MCAQQACRGVVKAHTSTAQFLLPHLVTDAVVFGTPEDRDAVLAEILAVLDAAATSTTAAAAATTSTLTAAGSSSAAPATARGNSSSSNSSGQRSSRRSGRSAAAAASHRLDIEHIATQAIFTLLDTLGGWSSMRGVLPSGQTDAAVDQVQ